MTQRRRNALARAALIALLAVAALAAGSASAPQAKAAGPVTQTLDEEVRGIKVVEGQAATGCSQQGPRPSQLVCSSSKGPQVKRASIINKGCILGLIGCVIDPVKDTVGGAVGGVVGDAVGGAADSIMNGIASWVAGGVGSLMEKTFNYMSKSTTPQVQKAWFQDRYKAMMRLAGLLAVLGIVGAMVAGLAKGDVGGALRAVFMYLPIAFVVVGALTAITQTGLLATDQLTQAFVSNFGQDTKEVTKGVLKYMMDSNGAGGGGERVAGGFVLLVMAFLALLGTLTLFIELLIRESIVYLVLLYAPIGMIASVWPPAKRVGRKLGILLFVAIVCKFFILTTFTFGATMISQMGRLDDVTGVLGGVIVMCLAAFTPMALLKLLPFDEIDAIQGRPNTPMGAQMAASNATQQGISKMLSAGKGKGADAQGPGGAKRKGPGASPSGGSGGGPAGGSGGGGGGVMPKAPAGGGGSGAAGGAAAGSAAALPLAGIAAAATVAAKGGPAAAKRASATAGPLAKSSGSGTSSSGGAQSGAQGGTRSPRRASAARTAAKKNITRGSVKSV